MQISDAGLKALMHEEGVRYVAYPDPASERAIKGTGSGAPWTIGVGHTGPEVHEGLVWTPEQVLAALDKDVDDREESVNRSVRVAIEQCQFDALVSFSFNVGIGAFESSTLLKKLNAADFVGASAEFMRWCIPSMIIPRRSRERAMFDGGTFPVIVMSPTTPRLIDVQRILGITMDGLFGPQTKAAVMNYQAANGLVVDGLVGPATLTAMGLLKE